MTAKIYTPAQLSNEDYQALPQRSGSFLHRMISHSPAKAMYGEIPRRKALDFGIWSHAMILEAERFKAEYCRDFDPSVYERILRKGDDYKAWLKERGVKTTGTNSELIQRILDTGEAVHIEEVERRAYQDGRPGVEFIPPADFDKIERMRHVAMSDPEFAAMVEGGHPEISIVTDEFKARPDLITGAQWIINYKTTTDADPGRFSRKAADLGYPMRAVMECELFKKAYGNYPRGYALMVQEKESPYICKLFIIYDASRPADEQPAAWHYGRSELAPAIKMYRKCCEENRWPALGGAEDLQIPDYIMKRAGLL